MVSRLKDVAVKAGYSVNTVSLALRESPRINELTRAKIAAVAKEIGYVPNNVARSLVNRQTMTVGVVLTDVTSPILTSVAQHIERLLAKRGYSMVLVTTDENLEHEKRALAVLREQQVDGMLIFPAQHDDLRHIDVLSSAHYPLVLLSGTHANNLNLIAMDDALGAYQATKYLISLGHQKVALLAGGNIKFEGYRRALDDSGISFDPTLVIEPGGNDYEHGYRAAPALFQLKPPPTALLATTDYLALGVIAWCKVHHIAIPERLAVIGFDDIEAAKYSDPTLTSVTYNAAKISDHAVNRLLELILQARGQSQRQPTEKTIVAPNLAVRQSSGSHVS